MGFFYDLVGNTNTEVATKKKFSLLDISKDDSQFMDSRDFSKSSVFTNSDSRSFNTQTSSIYNPIDNRSLSLVINSSGSTATTKKDLSQNSTPSFANTPTSSVIPSVSLEKTTKNLQSLTSGLDIGKYLMFGVLGFGAYFVAKKTPMGRKILGGKK